MLYKVLLLTVAALALTPKLFAENADRNILVENRQPKAVIVVAANPTQPAQWAVQELNHYIHAMTGVTLPVTDVPPEDGTFRIFVGPSSYTRALGIDETQLHNQELIIRSFDNALVLLGKDSQSFGGINYASGNGMWPEFDFFTSEIGTIYAVDDFLRLAFGIHWYWPGKIGETVSDKSTLAIADYDIQRKLSTTYRSLMPQFPIPETLCWWGTKVDIAQIPSLPEAVKNQYYVRWKVGGINFSANHSLATYQQRFSKTHPEYFAKNEDGSINTSQLCYSSEAVIDQVAKDAGFYFNGQTQDENGIQRLMSSTKDCLALVPNDNGIHCRCAQCMKLIQPATRDGFDSGITSNLHFSFVNRVAEKLYREFPDKKVSTLAYWNYFLPPSLDQFKLAPNVEVMLCRTNLTGAEPLFSERGYRQEDFDRWAQLSDHWYTWEYFIFPQYMKHNIFPAIVPHRVGEEFKRMLNYPGYQGSFIQIMEDDVKYRNANPIMDFHNLYIAFRLMDDKTGDVDQILSTYYKSFFGDAAEPVEAFFKTMEDLYLQYAGSKDRKPLNSSISWTALCSPQRLKSLETLLEQAKELATEEPYKTRVELLDKALLQRMKFCSQEVLNRPASDKNIICLNVDQANVTLDSPLWQSTVPVNAFVQNSSGNPPRVSTTVRALYNQKNLYIRFECQNLPGQRPRTTTTQRDSLDLFSDDCVEIFYDTGAIGGYYHVASNLNNAIYDEIKTFPTWNSSISTQSELTADGYRLMFIIPFSDNELPYPKDGGSLMVNFGRTVPALPFAERFLSWQPEGFHNPDNFGILVFRNDINLAGNGGFEKSRSGMYLGDMETGWMLSDGKAGDLDNTIKHSGNYSYRMDAPHYIASPVALAANQSYEFSAWVKVENLPAQKGYIYFDAPHRVKIIELEPGTYDWRQYKATFRGPFPKLVITPQKNCPEGKIWLDSIVVKPIAEK